MGHIARAGKPHASDSTFAQAQPLLLSGMAKTETKLLFAATTILPNGLKLNSRCGNMRLTNKSGEIPLFSPKQGDFVEARGTRIA